MAAPNFLSGFLQGFAQMQDRNKARKQDEDEKKARVKLYELQLDREKREQAKAQQQETALSELFARLQGTMPAPIAAQGPPNGVPGAQGPVAPAGGTAAPMSLSALLADPQTAMLMLRTGLVKGDDLLKREDSAANRAMMQKLVGGAGPAGMEMQGLKVGPSGELMPDFARPEIWQEVPSPDGMSMMQIDKQGRVMGSRPVSPAEKPQPTEEDKRTRDITAAFNTYEMALEGLMKGMKGTPTGPLIGKLPAITTAQQKAQGGMAAMIPVLKQIFRAAGEGVFTDKDQQALIDMIPTRETTPAAREALLQNIDNIIRAKLGMAPAGVVDFNSLPP
jgi:hypothetical protein